MSEIIFEMSKKNRQPMSQIPQQEVIHNTIPSSHLRRSKPLLPEASELQIVRHYTRLSQKNFSINTHFYPLGSCTMKYNPAGVHALAMSEKILRRHPYSHIDNSQGFLECLFELQEYIKTISGMAGVALSPMAGSQGEYAGVAMIKAYHDARGDHERTEIIVPDAAHGTNPASAVMCGYKVKEIPTAINGDIDLDALRAATGPQTAGIMLTNPSTLGTFARNIKEASEIIHEAGGLLYYDGANLNAILSKVRPGDMGFDVMHLNLHKTFATPHGGGGPGAGPIAVSARLCDYLPTPTVGTKNGEYYWIEQDERPQSIGQLSAFMGNAAILLRAYFYIRLLGREGLVRVAEHATLNANYLMSRLQVAGFTLAYPERRASHEFIVTLSSLKKEYGVTAMDFAKRLLDYGIHAPTTYFPLLIPECLLIEPTETECLETLDHFVDAMSSILEEVRRDPDFVKAAPHTMPVKRLDDVKAARELKLVWSAQ